MANYIFETMTQSDAAAFTATDYLIFTSSGTTASTVAVTPRAGSALASPGIDFTAGTKTLTFANASISGASTAAPSHIIFGDNSQLVLGTTNNDGALAAGTASTATGPASVLYGFAGNDTLTLGQGADYAYGGLGNDNIGTTASNGNYHIYGNAAGAPDATDGTDTIITGTGSSYINGNAGVDTITVGINAAGAVSASTGNNTVFGGADGDTITVQGAGFNHVNGNKGADTITAATATGNNELRGGADNDTITAGQGQDVLLGDNGNDTLIAGTGANHITVMNGGAGVDTFNFGTAGSASLAPTATTGGSQFYQEISDFTHGTDKIDIFPTAAGVNAAPAAGDLLYQAPGATFTTVAAAQTYAQQLLDTHTGTTDVAAIQVGGDTFLFYNGAGTGAAVDSVIKLDGVTASTLTQGATAATQDFI